MTDLTPPIGTLSIPKPAGYWIVGNSTWRTQFPLGKRPAWFHRIMTRLLLGWEWKNND